jgi:tetratricopeptide (TPR) repeat protein
MRQTRPSLYGRAAPLPTALLAQRALWAQHYFRRGLRMAGVFLSYDRDDAAAARVIAAALEKAGHSVWWDLHVRGGAQFSKVIEEALKAADAVVVLWSRNSVDSAWVRDEAAAGRDSGRLVPASLDGTEPPLGFRQFQTIDLSDWKRGAKSRGRTEIQHAVEQLAGGSSEPCAVISDQKPDLRVRPRAAAILALPVIAAIAAGAYFLWPSSSSAVPTVTVVPASAGPMAQALSRDLFAKLGILQASNSSALQLVEEGAGNRPDLIFKVDASGAGTASKATLLLLSGRNRELLWSGDFDQPSGNPSDLKQQLAFSAANVLDCASEAYGPSGRSLDEKTRRLYLTGCGSFTQISGADLESLARTFREVTRRAPQFEGGWARLLNAEDETIFNPPWDHDTPAARAQFKADIAAARKVNPDLPEGYIGDAELVASDDFAQALRFYELGAEKNPDDASALGARSFARLEVGRLQEAVSDARRAVQLRPFSPRAQEAYISVLTYSGQFDAARQELSKAEALFPGASNFAAARYRLNLRYGSAEEALKRVQQGQEQAFPGQELFLKARIDRSPANVALALDAARKRLDGSSLITADYIQNLAEFGRTDELIDFLLRSPSTPRRGRFIGVLFRPAFRNFWRDPRSMQVAARFGLVGYWRSSGHWPDLCTWPDLPYDCKKEAAKLSA